MRSIIKKSYIINKTNIEVKSLDKKSERLRVRS